MVFGIPGRIGHYTWGNRRVVKGVIRVITLTGLSYHERGNYPNAEGYQGYFGLYLLSFYHQVHLLNPPQNARAYTVHIYIYIYNIRVKRVIRMSTFTEIRLEPWRSRTFGFRLPARANQEKVMQYT